MVSDAPSSGRYIDIACGDMHCVALRADGTIVGWGMHINGQLDFPPTPGWKAVAADANTTYALKTDGSLVGWGHWRGSFPGTYQAIEGGNQWMVGLRTDGSIGAIGSDYYGNRSDVPSGNDFVAVSAGSGHGLALRSDGTLAGWGLNDDGQADVPPGNQFVAISAGRWFSVGIEVVSNENRPPEIDEYTPATPLTINVGDSTCFEVWAHDADRDPLSHSWKLDGQAIVGARESAWTYSPGNDAAGHHHMLTVTVSDGFGGTASHSWEVIVSFGYCEGDFDCDGLSDEAENNIYSTDPENPDTDGDMLDDKYEVDRMHCTDPLINLADMDHDTNFNALDINIFRNYFMARDQKADVNCDGTIDAKDINDFRNAFMASDKQ
jgi:hypothetical protein